jgi:hypothetical protein
VPVSVGEQTTIGFQPVPRDHCARPCETVNDLAVLKDIAQSVQDTG